MDLKECNCREKRRQNKVKVVVVKRRGNKKESIRPHPMGKNALNHPRPDTPEPRRMS